MTKPPSWQSRIVGHGLEDPEQLLANPQNWRTHPQGQQDAMTGVLDQVGWVQDVIVNTRTGNLIDGHLRVSLAISRGEQVPVVYVDLSPQEEKLVLATFDRLTQMAGIDEDKLNELLAEATESFPDLTEILDGIAEQLGDTAAQESGATPGLTDEDEVPEEPKNPVTHVGDLWILSDTTCPHCGDRNE